jgi:hypothetical protein
MRAASLADHDKPVTARQADAVVDTVAEFSDGDTARSIAPCWMMASVKPILGERAPRPVRGDSHRKHDDRQYSPGPRRRLLAPRHHETAPILAFV